MVVVDVTPEWLIEHHVSGSVIVGKTCRGRAKLDALETGTWDVADTAVSEPGLNFYPLGGWVRVGLSWSRDYSEFHGWYVNFQLPLEPSRFGRGLAAVQLVVSDCHDGLRDAIAWVLAGASWQRSPHALHDGCLTKSTGAARQVVTVPHRSRPWLYFMLAPARPGASLTSCRACRGARAPALA